MKKIPKYIIKQIEKNPALFNWNMLEYRKYKFDEEFVNKYDVFLEWSPMCYYSLDYDKLSYKFYKKHRPKIESTINLWNKNCYNEIAPKFYSALKKNMIKCPRYLK